MLTRWADSIARLGCPSTLSTRISVRLDGLYLDQISCVSSIGRGNSNRFLDRSNQNWLQWQQSFHWLLMENLSQRKCLHFWSDSKLQSSRMGIKSQTSSNLSQIRPFTMELLALEREKVLPYKPKKIYMCVCFSFPDPTYVFTDPKKKKKKKSALVTKHTARFCPCRPFLFRYIMWHWRISGTLLSPLMHSVR